MSGGVSNIAMKPTSVTYTNAIGVCKRADPPDLKSALLLLGEAQKKDGVKPNMFMFSAAIWVSEACKDAKAAVFLLKTMRKNKCTPNAVAYDGGKFHPYSIASLRHSLSHFLDHFSIVSVRVTGKRRGSLFSIQIDET